MESVPLTMTFYAPCLVGDLYVRGRAPARQTRGPKHGIGGGSKPPVVHDAQELPHIGKPPVGMTPKDQVLAVVDDRFPCDREPAGVVRTARALHGILE